MKNQCKSVDASQFEKPTQNKSDHKTGTKEWADSNVNFMTGCTNDCKYCFEKKEPVYNPVTVVYEPPYEKKPCQMITVEYFPPPKKEPLQMVTVEYLPYIKNDYGLVEVIYERESDKWTNSESKESNGSLIKNLNNNDGKDKKS
jgi:hypothetical protein